MTTTLKRTLCIWLPRWPWQRLAAERPELERRTTLIYAPRPRGGFYLVASRSHLAPRDASVSRSETATAGISRSEMAASEMAAGMPLAEALALVQSREAAAPELIAHDPAADRLALAELAQACHEFSPTVGCEVAEQPSSLLLDVGGTAGLFGGERALAQRVQRTFQERGFNVRTALADSIGAAWAAAHFSPQCNPVSQCSPVSPKRGAGEQEPMIVPAGESLVALRGLPLAALRLPEDTLALLVRLGLRKVGQAAALPREALLARFGPELLRRLDQLAGTAAETIATRRPAEELESEWLFETPAMKQEAIHVALDGLLGVLAPKLQARGEGALALHCRLAGEGSPTELTVNLFRPQASAAYLGQLLRWQLETLRRDGPVSAVRLTVAASGPVRWEQQELFAPEKRRRSPEQLAELVDRLSCRLGRQAVLRPALLRDAQPEHACLHMPLTGALPRASRQAPSVAWFPAAWRPTRLLAAPEELGDVALSSNGVPHLFRALGTQQQVVRRWGPERIETGWWRGGVRRDYYIVETALGSRWWLFRDLSSKRWFLQGEFA